MNKKSEKSLTELRLEQWLETGIDKKSGQPKYLWIFTKKTFLALLITILAGVTYTSILTTKIFLKMFFPS